jgi:transposase-like protein
MKCPRCFNDSTVKNGKKYALDIKQWYYCHNCRHLFYIKVDQQKPIKPLRRFSVRKETLRQIIKSDMEEDKHQVITEYPFLA